MAACRVLDEATPSPCPWEGEGICRVEVGTPRLRPAQRGEGQTLRLVGARGIDLITKKVNSGSDRPLSLGGGTGRGCETREVLSAVPLYDTHGNMVATLARSGSSYTLGNEQSYDVWGGVRSGSSSEQQGYVANLGHRADPESFLTYMRARYYEPMSGRFISEDKKRDGQNWMVYADNAPSYKADFNGCNAISLALLLSAIQVFIDFVEKGLGINISPYSEAAVILSAWFARARAIWLGAQTMWRLGMMSLARSAAWCTTMAPWGGSFDAMAGTAFLVGSFIMTALLVVDFYLLQQELFLALVEEGDSYFMDHRDQYLD